MLELSGKEGARASLRGARPTIVQLLDTKDSTHQWHTAVDVDEPLFQPFPPEIVFTNFEPFREYEAILSLRNNDKVSRRVKVEPTKSPFFSAVQVRRKDSGSSKIAAGMEAVLARAGFRGRVQLWPSGDPGVLRVEVRYALATS